MTIACAGFVRTMAVATAAPTLAFTNSRREVDWAMARPPSADYRRDCSEAVRAEATIGAMKLIECVPNFSEGRDRAVIDAIVGEIRATPGAVLMDVDPGVATNRTVVTFLGSP